VTRAPARACGIAALTAALKNRHLGDHMVRRKYQQQGRVLSRGLSERMQCGGGDRRRRVARCRFKQEIGLQPDLVELLGDQKAVVLVGHGNRPAQPRESVESTQGVLQQRKLVDQAEELLRIVRSRKGPQTGSGTATQDYRANDRGIH
jgi:hypothetical protein